MDASDFDLEEDLKYGTDPGVNTFRNNRMLVLNADSIGLLRQQLLNNLGIDETRKFLFRFGFQSGYSDFLQLKMNYEFDTEEELLKAGPKIHTDRGFVAAEIDEISYDREAGDFYYAGTWHNSYEAQQHVIYNGEADQPVCWSVMGYASAWSSGFIERPVLGLETQCLGMGDDVCKWEIKPINEWGPEADPYINALEDLFIGEELMKYYSYMGDKKGHTGKMELAKKTRMPETKASTASDRKENIEMFREAIEEIIGKRPPEL
ncbi:XylR N-terminal domain-containing protein [Natronolimnohabitans sp. A-GB9]|uniref:XylR N-terminal domain-containing protein n=1 Tax=Natronolimnohabitans sp. A-GB9 TaxID=3069757 RepID=UPI0027B19A63|nr:XylR N-terminal domain-containing protein [Natronolimnohabitans sp. A-GB9]MDQ2052536.1 XylR N-terminal domain-containing protein [Natronolimnohabitans sp. A-GB9]